MACRVNGLARPFYTRRLLARLAFFAFGFGQPTTAIFVLCTTCAPFWPVSVVGIASFWPQRLPLIFAGRSVVRAEWGPSGSFSSKLEMGASGIDLNELVVMPFAMSVLPTRSRRMPCPCRITTRSGNAAPPWETR